MLKKTIVAAVIAAGFLSYSFATQFVVAQTEDVRKVTPPAAPRAQVLLLGTFHFEDAGRDDYKPKFKLDVLSWPRQQEIAALLNSLGRYQPTKIAVEWPAEKQGDLDALYQKYLAGQFELQANEIYQLGFRLAKQLGPPEAFCDRCAPAMVRPKYLNGFTDSAHPGEQPSGTLKTRTGMDCLLR